MNKKKKLAAVLLLFAILSDARSQAPAAATTPTRTAIEWRNIGLAARGADAVAAFTKAVELQPDIGDWWQRLGDALASTGNHAAAINAFRKANALGVFSAGGTDAKAYRSLAMSQAALGQKDAALRSYEEAVFHASFALAWYNEYRTSLGLEPVTESAVVESRNLTFRREQGSPANLQARIVVLCAEAQKLQKQGHDITGGSLGEIVVQKLRDAVSLDPSRAESHALYAEALSRESETEPAVAEFREAIRLAPSIARYHHLLGQTLSRAGRSQEAIPEEQSAIRIEPSASLYVSLAAEQDRAGDVNGSIDSFTEATKLDPSAARTHASLAAVLAKAKRPDEAMVEYQHALDLALNLEPEFRAINIDSWRKSYNTLLQKACDGGDAASCGKSVFFQIEKVELTREGDFVVKDTAEWVRTNCAKIVVITGHADGEESDPMVLSLARARAVEARLRALGVTAKITVQGVGAMPGVGSVVGDAENRRVDIECRR